MSEVTIRKVNPDELDTLLTFSKKVFFDAFYHLNNPADMELYAAKAFTPQQFLSELNNPNSNFYFAVIEDVIVGYIKLNTGAAQTEFQADNSLEVERIYVSADHQRKEIGTHLIDFAVAIALAKKKDFVWLGVWESNAQAIKFYRRNGFEVFAQHDFWLGNDLQKDVLMRRPLPTLAEGEG